MGRISDARQRLLDAALDLIGEHSYAGVSVDAICERAGVRKGSFYYFFESKSELAVAALEEFWKLRKPDLDECFSPMYTPLERIQRRLNFIHNHQTRMLEERGHIEGCPVFALGSEMSMQDERIRAKVSEILLRYSRYWESAVREAHLEGSIVAPDAKAKAQAIFSFIEGSLTQARILQDMSPINDLVENGLHLLGARAHVEVA